MVVLQIESVLNMPNNIYTKNYQKFDINFQKNIEIHFFSDIVREVYFTILCL